MQLGLPIDHEQHQKERELTYETSGLVFKVTAPMGNLGA
jgi:hypothetical protein